MTKRFKMSVEIRNDDKHGPNSIFVMPNEDPEGLWCLYEPPSVPVFGGEEQVKLENRIEELEGLVTELRGRMAWLRDGMALMVLKSIPPTVGGINSADDSLRELDKSQEPPIKKVEEIPVEIPKTKILAIDLLAQALYDWSSGRIDGPACKLQATRYLDGLEVSALIRQVFDSAVDEARDNQ